MGDIVMVIISYCDRECMCVKTFLTLLFYFFFFFFPFSCLLFEFQGQLRADFLTLDERACTWRGGNRKGVLRGKKEVRPEKKKGGFQLEMEKKKKKN